MDQKSQGWQTITLGGSAVAFMCPEVTPQGQTVERENKRTRDHRGDIERVHLSSPDNHELYVEVIRFRDLSPQEEYERHRPHLEKRFGADSVTPLNETTFGDLPAWAYGFRWSGGERSVLSLEVERDTYRLLWNPRSHLNSQVVATLVVRSESG